MNYIEKVYAVIWTDEARKEYGVPKNKIIVVVEPKEDIKVNISKSKIGRPKIRYADLLAIFYKRTEADAFRDRNNDWKTVEVQLFK